MQVSPAPRPPAAEAADLLIIGVPEDYSSDLSDQLGAFGSELLAAAGDDFTGKSGQKAVFPSFGRVAAARVGLVGLGKGDPTGLREAAGHAAATARSKGNTSLAISFGDLDTHQWNAVLEGLQEGSYVFDRYKAKDSRKSALATVTVLGESDSSAGTLGAAIAAGRALARDLVNEPAEALYPETLAEAALALASDRIEVEVWDFARIRAAGMGGIEAVGKGSNREPRFIHLTYKPAGKATRKLGLVGKGVTYDAGGLNLKPGAGLQTMRCDMAGSAAVVGVFRALAELQPNVEVHGIIGAVENMLGGSAYKLGDVLKISNGKTVEVHNTDAEGRLVLADCLTYASKLELDAMVDIATLTGACIVALGEHYTGLFTSDDGLADELSASADRSGEGLWRLPLANRYRDKLKSEWADMKNIGGRSAGSITAALFLSNFVENTRWAHLDIAGPAFSDKASGHFASGGLGAMVPTLTRWIASS
jgi:leucyl aminopeptidase